jgi:hypothetical protein
MESQDYDRRQGPGHFMMERRKREQSAGCSDRCLAEIGLYIRPRRRRSSGRRPGPRPRTPSGPPARTFCPAPSLSLAVFSENQGRRDIRIEFDLEELIDNGKCVREARQVRQIEEEGIDAGWPPLG